MFPSAVLYSLIDLRRSDMIRLDNNNNNNNDKNTNKDSVGYKIIFKRT